MASMAQSGTPTRFMVSLGMKLYVHVCVRKKDSGGEAR